MDPRGFLDVAQAVINSRTLISRLLNMPVKFVKSTFCAFVLLFGFVTGAETATGQSLDQSSLGSSSDLSAKRALISSILLPGLGHKYVNNGNWNRWAVAYAAADVSLWLSVLGGEWHRNSLVRSYETLAAGSAGASLAGKDRSFYLNLATFESSEVYLETMLRTRQWDQLDYVSDSAYQWEWESEESFLEFRDLRNDAESLKRRRSFLIAGLVVNRLLSGAISARKAGKLNRSTLSASVSAPIDTLPVLTVRMGF